MKAICVNSSRELELRNVPDVGEPKAEYVTVVIEAAAIIPGDKAFLKIPDWPGSTVHDIWGASASGKVVSVGANVPSGLLGSNVAIYRALMPDKPPIGLWCETAQVHYLTCLPLPDDAKALNYSGSLVNVITAYAFLEHAILENHKSIIITAGNSSTGRSLAVLARRRGVPTISIVRTFEAAAELEVNNIEHVIVSQGKFTSELSELAARLNSTAVFDGVGGELVSSIAPVLPLDSTIFCYGLLGGMAPLSISSMLLLMKNLKLRRFGNGESITVVDKDKLMNALKDLQTCIDDNFFHTRIGKTFRLNQFDAAMAFEKVPGVRAVFTPN